MSGKVIKALIDIADIKWIVPDDMKRHEQLHKEFQHIKNNNVLWNIVFSENKKDN